MTSSGRPRKRQRSALRDEEGNVERPPQWGFALDTLLDRLSGVKCEATALRDEKNGKVVAIDENIAAAAAAAKAAARVSRRLPSEDVDIFSRGVRVEAEREPPDVPKVPPLPAMKMLMEPDPPEKLIHEQSIIVRAQAINRKNAELARERLPKQPEAQRNKTFHDYFLDEAMWMAADFREERKWKIQMAKKISKMVMQYHSQREQREARVKAEARNRLVKVANGIARDVRKFWSQISEIADYRSSLVEEAAMEKKRASRLHHLLDTTAAFSRSLARSLNSPGDIDLRAESAPSRQVTFDGAEHFSEKPEQLPSRHERSPSRIVHNEERERHKNNSQADKVAIDDDTDLIVRDGTAVDDESTLIAAEAEDGNNIHEITELQGDANMSVDELLRSQGIDPAAYKADERKYLDDEEESSVPSSEDSDPDKAAFNDDFAGDGDASDDESTIRAAEAGEEKDAAEIGNLKADVELDVDDILRSQGIDPAKYYSDRKRYGRTDEEEDIEENGVVTPKNAPPTERVPSNPGAPAKVGRALGICFPIAPAGGAVKLSSEPNATLGTDTVLKGQVNGVNEVDLVAKFQQVLPESEPLHPSKHVPCFREPALLRGSLRDYQAAGVSWLISLYSQNINGILADEMGLGKTIQTISLLAWLAIEKGVWGPHLIVVPTSVMVNWEVEFKKWLPGFKVLTYFGTMKERKQKRQGWTRPNSFHVCITSYNLAVQDSVVLKRKKWMYLILDEAHNIKNFQSQRWQTLLNFSSQRRLLITGTPLQNSVMELWSLMHFLMPSIFESHSEFKDWFSKPLLEGKLSDEIVVKLHEVLRPFLLRRLKVDVERGLPPKYEHTLKCPLSKRQRELYEDFIARSDVQDTLQTGDFFSVMNVLMQLRKVCNHPDLFEGRQILSPLAMQAIFYPVPAIVTRMFDKPPERCIDLDLLGLNLCSSESSWPGRWYSKEGSHISAENDIRADLLQMSRGRRGVCANPVTASSNAHTTASDRAASFRCSQLRYFAQRTAVSIRRQALFGEDLRSACQMTPSSLVEALRCPDSLSVQFLPDRFSSLVRTMDTVARESTRVCDRFVCCTSKVSAPVVEIRFRGDDHLYGRMKEALSSYNRVTKRLQTMFRSFDVRCKVTIPDTRLVQWDCGKLQVLDKLLRRLRTSGSRVLIFTQMTKVLDILESFLNLHSWRYLRLDGTTKTDDRQRIVERFNQDGRIFCMILTTRAGGIGLNLTGADSVVFYDTDYNPAIDNQAQDRAHRIGQTKPVHIYRLVSEQTVEESILRRANEKRALESKVISDAGFTTDSITHQNQRRTTDASCPDRALPQSRLSQGKPMPSQPGGQTKNGITGSQRSDGHTTNGNRSVPVTDSRQVGSVPISASQSLSSAIETAYGTYAGPIGEMDMAMDRDACRSKTNTDALRYQDVTTRLLAAEDDRERIAMFTAEQEQRELQAEFDETCPASIAQGATDDDTQAATGGNEVSYDQLEASLTPVQRYALRLIERWRAEILCADERGSMDKWGHDLPHGNGRDGKGDGDGALDDFTMATELRDSRTADSQDGESEEDEPLFYDIDSTANGRRSYLKALTDTDADIKLYLPLRDGGPEELKVSSVVSGTAAAGLECAEDAAFFPHAYNRMSRTIFSTHRQKEKARANLKKRKAEKEARKKRELEMATAAAQRDRENAASIMQAARPVPAVEKAKHAKSKADPSKSIGGPVSKKMRMEGSYKAKGTSGQGTAGSGSDGTSAANTGLFKKSTKKTVRRLTLGGGRSSLSGIAMPGEGIGLNEGWTRNEDQRVIGAAADWNNNMKLVADVLSLDVTVRAGIRRRRSEKHCLERLVNSLQKDAKSGPPVPKATESDADIFRKHIDNLMVATSAATKKPPDWMTLPTIPTDWHPSQTKVTNEVASKTSARIKGSIPPTLTAVFPMIQTPPHFKVGFKSTETTPQALNRKRFPFLRPPRDDQRFGSQRPGSGGQRSGNPSRNPRSGQSSQGNAVPSQRGGPPAQRSGPTLQRSAESGRAGAQASAGQGQATSSLGKGSSRPVKGSAAALVARNASAHTRTNSANRAVPAKMKTGEVVGAAPRPVQLGGAVPRPASMGPRKSLFVPGTSARLNICQVGGSVPSFPKPAPAARSTALDSKSEPLRKPILGKVPLSAVQLRSGKIAGTGARDPTVLVAANSGSNGVMRSATERVPVRNGGVGQSAPNANRPGELHTIKEKGSKEPEVKASAVGVPGSVTPSAEKAASAPPNATKDTPVNKNEKTDKV